MHYDFHIGKHQLMSLDLTFYAAHEDIKLSVNTKKYSGWMVCIYIGRGKLSFTGVVNVTLNFHQGMMLLEGKN